MGKELTCPYHEGFFRANSQVGDGVPARQLAAEIATLPPPCSVGPVLAPAEAICADAVKKSVYHHTTLGWLRRTLIRKQLFVGVSGYSSLSALIAAMGSRSGGMRSIAVIPIKQVCISPSYRSLLAATPAWRASMK